MEIINIDILFVLFKAPTESMPVFSSIFRNTTLRHSLYLGLGGLQTENNVLKQQLHIDT